MKLMEGLIDKYVPHTDSTSGSFSVLDVGSHSSNGPSYRRMCEDRGLAYTGMDIREGPNVDLVVHHDFQNTFSDHISGNYDIVISGQCMEHVAAPWLWIREIYKLVEVGGLVIVIAPWKWQFHAHPIDCWRVLPDGMRGLFVWTDLKVLEVGIPEGTPDCFGVGTK